MKKFFLTALIFVIMAANLDVCSAEPAPVLLSEHTAKEICSEIKSVTESESFPFKLKKLRRESNPGESDTITRTWVCYWEKKATKKSEAHISFGTDDKNRPFIVTVAAPPEAVRRDAELAHLLTVAIYFLPEMFDVTPKDCLKIIDGFLDNPRAVEWKGWDSAHKKCVHVVRINHIANARIEYLGFILYADNGANEFGGVANGKFTGTFFDAA